MASLLNISEDCVSKILSLTSPQDACRMLAVSKEFRNPAESNVVWTKFLPTDCHHIVSSAFDADRSVYNPLIKFSSKKELYFLLSNYILVDGGSKAFALEKSTGRKLYILSARELSILDDGSNWRWTSMQESRFGEVAELKAAERLEIEGNIRSEALSPNTKYGAYLVFKMSDDAYGLDSIPCETSIASGGHVVATSTATLRDPDDKKGRLPGLFYANRMQKMKERVINRGDGGSAACKRGDGWLEIEVGDFFVGGDHKSHEVITMRVVEIKGFQLKGGLIVQGIEVRPS